MAKPSQLPRWATGGSAPVTPEPTEVKKDGGWAAAEKPPNNYFNWWMKVVYLWCQYLDGLTNEALTWASAHVFNSTVTISTAPTQSNHAVRKTDLDAEATARANADSAESTTRYNTDILKANLAGADFTGAVTVQTPTTAAQAARKDYIDGKFPVVNSQQNFGTPSAASDVATKGYVDGFKPQMAKAWGILQTGAAGSVTVLAGFNIASASYSGTTLSVTFTTAMGSSNYAPFAQLTGPSATYFLAAAYAASASAAGVCVVNTSCAIQNWPSGFYMAFVVYAT